MKNRSFGIFVLAAMLGVVFISAQQPKPKPRSKPKQEAVAQAQPEKQQMVEIETAYGKMVLKLYNETPLHRDNFIKLVKEGFYDSLLFHRIIRNFMIQGGDPQSRNAPQDAMLGNGDVGYRIPPEFNSYLIHKRGALAAARDDNPQRASSGCQFYIVQGKKYTVKELNDVSNGINLNMKTKLLQAITNSDSVMARVDDFKIRGDKEGMHKYFMDLQPKIDAIYSKMEFRYNPYQTATYTTVGGAPHLDMNYTVFGEVVSGFNVLDSIASVQTGLGDRPLKDVRMRIRLLK
jgi:peptidyl-prolyl cis-trans isomerase B (cyclophilin B)